MTGQWQYLKWGDLATLEYGKGLRNCQNAVGKYRVFGTDGPIGWHNEPLCNHDSVIVGRKGAYRGIHYSPNPFYVIDTAFYLKPKANFDMRWAYYELLTHDINSMDSGSAIPSTSRESFYQLPVKVPTLPEQRAIAHVLGTLDNKIELNRKMNETLEAMARAIFKSWFVDFDPVRAKAAGRDPGLPKEIADLFPNSFENSELGKIPKGWEIKTLLDVTEVITKGTTPTQEDVSDAPSSDVLVNYLRVNAIAEDGSILDDKLSRIPDSVHRGVLKRSILQSGDVVYTIAGTIGRMSIIEEHLLPANTNQAIAILRPKSTTPPIFLAFTMKQSAFQEELHSNVVHAVQANLSLGMISRAKAIFPPEGIFGKMLKPLEEIIKKVNINRKQSRTFANIRDTLLPKLLSGEICIKDAEKFLESAA